MGNDIADIRLLVEGALALYESDAEPLHRLGMKNNAEVAASAFDTIGTARYDLRERIAACSRAIWLKPSGKAKNGSTNNYNDARQNHSVGHFLFSRIAVQNLSDSIFLC